MSDTTKTAILKVEIDQKTALANLQDTNAKISGLKQLVSDLNKEYKQGKLTQEEYSKAKTDLDLKIQQETKSRNILVQAVQAENNSLNAQKALLADLTAQRDQINRGNEQGAKQYEAITKRIKELNESLRETKKESGESNEALQKLIEGIRIGEFELGGKAKNIVSILQGSTLVSGATAAAAAIAGLGAAYASSAAGGKDLEETQNRLKAQWEIFAGAIGGEISEGGGLLGTIVKYASGIGKGFIAAAGDVATLGQGGFIKAAEDDEKQISKVAEAYNKITELQFEQMQNEVIASKQRKEAYELVQLREDKERSLNERLETANRIVEIQKNSVENSVEALKKQAGELVKIGDLTNNNVLDERNISGLRKQYLELLVRINGEEAARERRISQAEVAAKNLTNEITKQNEELAKQNRDARFGAQLGKSEAEGDLAKRVGGVLSDAGTNKKITDAKITSDSLKKIDADYTRAVAESSKLRQEEERREADEKQKATERNIRNDREAMRSLREISGAARTILGQNSAAYKAVGTTDAIISTYVAADKALEIYGPTPVGYAAMAAAIATGLANVLQINKAAGGGTFETKGPTMLLVGDNPGGRERIDVTPLSGKGQTVVSPNSNLVAMAGGGSLIASGGMVTNQMSNSVNSEFMMGDLFKRIPQPIVSWKEGLIMDSRVKYKESLINR